MSKTSALTHGHSANGKRSSEYSTWTEMKQRCYNPNNSHYADYGGRGITVCQRWLDSFEDFYTDMGPKPSLAHTLDRKDNDGIYELSNCRWATRKEQAANRAINIMVTYQGETKPLKAWAEVLGISYNKLYYHFKKYHK